MIIGLVGPVQEDIEFVVDTLNVNKSFQYIDTTELLRISDRSIIGSLTSQDNYKKYVLKRLENLFGTVIVSGNLVLSEKICEWLLDNGHTLAIVARKSIDSYDEHTISYTGKYWDDKSSQKYNLEVRWSKTYDRLNKFSNQPYLIDVSDNTNEDLSRLLQKSSEYANSNDCNWEYEELLDYVKIRKEDNMATMEESIRKAMMELGMDVDCTEDKSIDNNDTKAKTSTKKAKKMNKKVVEKPKDTMENCKDTKVEEAEESTEDRGDSESIFVKVTDDSMAILLPTDLTLEKQEICGMTFMVATVQLPDITSRSLQELPIMAQISNNAPKEYKRQPIISDKEPVRSSDEDTELDDLLKEKSYLDSEIKKYRSIGDIAKVDELRKQRRVVRNKINKLK